MKRFFTSLTTFKTIPLTAIVLMTICVSIFAFCVFYLTGLTTSYSDAMSHLNLARFVIDNIEPGVSQIGGVWLPLNHLLPLLLIWNNWAWHSGFAGSFFSMAAFVLAALAVRQIVYIITHNKLASTIGVVAFSLNLNLLYLQSTALTESLYLGLFTLSALFFVRWLVAEDSKYLLLVGLFGFLQVLTRYDGWFVVCIEVFLVAYREFVYQKRSIQETIGKTLFVLFPIAFGMSLWLLWNALIFGGPLFFLLGPFSAHTQQEYIKNQVGLITKGNIAVSSLAYWYAVIDNIGLFMTVVSLLGIPVFLLQKIRKLSMHSKTLILCFLSAPIMFNVIALYLGFSILNVPELHWNPSSDPGGYWFNVRYGILALPAAAILIGILASGRKILAYLLFFLILFQSILLYREGIITVIDGVQGSSSFNNQDIAAELSQKVGKSDKVLMSIAFFNPVAFRSNVYLNQIIHEGVSKVWPFALQEPEKYAQFIVVSRGDVGDPLYTSLFKNQKGKFLASYSKVFEGKHANVYQIRSETDSFILRQGEGLFARGRQFVLHGINSYDLAYRSDKEIDETFKNLETAHINVIRFWMFGDGFTEGFQPSAGNLNEVRLKKVDYIIARARHFGIRLIPTLVNNWDDFGGKGVYLTWIGKGPENADTLFYTNEYAISLFKNYVNTVLSRKNSITNVLYKEEPSILAWDIMNEPRGDLQSDLYNWTKNIASYIKQNDQNHLVMIGSERSGGQYDSNPPLCSLSEIDICSIHIYVTHNNSLLSSSLPDVSSLLSKEKNIAKSVSKPIITIPDTSFGFSPNELNGKYNKSDLLQVISTK